MKQLIDAARRVIEHWERGNLAGAVNELSNKLSTVLNEIEEASPEQIAQARKYYCAKCGERLTARQDYGPEGAGWAVEPCEKCLEQAVEEALVEE